jgi:peptide chain release factor 1
LRIEFGGLCPARHATVCAAFAFFGSFMSNLADRVARIATRFEELTEQMATPAVASDFSRLNELNREREEIEELATTYRRYEKVQQQLAENQLFLNEEDEEMRALAAAEIETLTAELDALDKHMKSLLLPRDPKDEKNVIVEIRAGTGGDEAGLFAAELYRMYVRWAEAHNFKTEELSIAETGLGGLKEVVFAVKGKGAYSKLKYESGVHRVQRVPVTESAGRIHTSAATVAVLPEVDDFEIQVHDNDIRVDVFRSSGPGGQSVNTTDSAVRMTHIPTGTVVSMQNEKSQIQNRAAALRVMQSRLLLIKQAEEAAERKEMAGDVKASWGDQMRSYVLNPYQMVKDLRTEFETGNPSAVFDGDIDGFIEAGIRWQIAQRKSADSD